MKIKNIQLKNFRNYPELSLDINSSMIVLSGPNAVGKTNLLESIYFSSVFKSFRNDAEFIFLKGTNSAELKIEFESNKDTHQLEVFLEKREKIYANFVLDKVKKRRKEALGLVKIVIFEPKDVEMFSQSPENRRKYLNMVLSQKSINYLDDLANYKQVLAQKNKLLSEMRMGSGSEEQLEVWNAQLLDIGSRIILERKNLIKFLNTSVAEVYSGITKFNRPIEVVYESIPGEELEDIRNNFAENLELKKTKERLLGSSLVGPHKDDMFLKSDGLYLSPFSSRGEQRSQVLALKILELEYLSDGDEKPVLLLDDVLSELDETRGKYLLEYLQGKYQTFITTTHQQDVIGQHITLTPSIQEDKV